MPRHGSFNAVPQTRETALVLRYRKPVHVRSKRVGLVRRGHEALGSHLQLRTHGGCGIRRECRTDSSSPHRKGLEGLRRLHDGVPSEGSRQTLERRDPASRKARKASEDSSEAGEGVPRPGPTLRVLPQGREGIGREHRLVAGQQPLQAHQGQSLLALRPSSTG